MTNDEVADLLGKIAGAGTVLGVAIPGAGGVAAAIAGAAVGIAADAVRGSLPKGQPIERVKDRSELFAAMRAHWAAEQAALAKGSRT